MAMLARTIYRPCSFRDKLSKVKNVIGVVHHDPVLVCSCKSLHSVTDYTTRTTPVATTPFSFWLTLKKSVVLSQFLPNETCSNTRSYYCIPGDWTCPGKSCRTNNFASNESCIECGREKPEGATFDGGRFKRKKVKTRPDWTCPDLECGTSNSASINRCSKCFKDNPDMPQFTVHTYKKKEFLREQDRRNQVEDSRNQRGDWRNQRGDRRNLQLLLVDTKFEEREVDPLSWTCPKMECGANNHSHRMDCFICLARRPLDTMSEDYGRRHRSDGAGPEDGSQAGYT